MKKQALRRSSMQLHSLADLSEISDLHGQKETIQREREVAECEASEDDVADVDDTLVMSLRDFEGSRRHDFCPSPASMQ